MTSYVVASLLHRQNLLLPDEYSIRLDMIDNQHIRDAIRRMNVESGGGRMSISHDAGELEACEVLFFGGGQHCRHCDLGPFPGGSYRKAL